MMLKHRLINSYLATLIIAIAGSAAAFLIVKVAYRNTNTVVKMNSEASYANLQDAILHSAPDGVFVGQKAAQ